MQRNAHKPATTSVAKRPAFTLIEMVAVLVVLTAVAAMVVPLLDLEFEVGSDSKTKEQIATETSMNRVYKVIMGTPDRQGVWADLGQRPELFPRDLSVLYFSHDQLNAYPTFSNLAGVPSFDPITKTGWRGPYLVQPSGKTHVRVSDLTQRPTLADAWGNPFILHSDFNGDGVVTSTESKYAFLVSYGENEQLEFLRDVSVTAQDEHSMRAITFTGNELADTTAIMSEPRGDDIILFFRIADTRQ